MKLLNAIALAVLSVGLTPIAFGQVGIDRIELGSGEPGQAGVENATAVTNDIYHVPQYLPGHPTAATIWPRVVDVPCRRTGAALHCDGYQWTPRLGRAEYLFFRAVMAPAAVQTVSSVPVEVVHPVAPAVAALPAQQEVTTVARPRPRPRGTAAARATRSAKQDRQ